MPETIGGVNHVPSIRRFRCALLSLVATVLGAAACAGCGDVRLLATPTPTPTPFPTAVAAAAPPSLGQVFPRPRCGQYDDYQSSSMAFYSLSAIVQAGLDDGTRETEAESLKSAVTRFERTVRRILDGETLEAPDPIEELAQLWVASDGCMR